MVDQDWLHALRSRADLPPARARVPLLASNSRIGSVETDFLYQIASLSNIDGHEVLLIEEQPEAAADLPTQPACVAGHVLGEVSASLNYIATLLHGQGLAGAWRDEQLAVLGPDGKRLGSVERAAVRALGVPTLAVHLVGQAPDGRFWIQQRAFDKPNDPGLLDTLMGGMVSSADTVKTALARETWEEAGLVLADLDDVRYRNRLHIRRPARDGGGTGYVDENIDWYSCVVPDGVVPENQDGEVDRFLLMDRPQLLQALHDNRFTLEAALILAEVLQA